MQTKINELLKNGVNIPNPATVEIGPDVKPERIKPGVTVHNGCRIFGAQTLIEEGAVLGAEGPVTVENCYIGPNVELGGGYFCEAVFLAGVKAGLGAHVRAGTIMEEQSSIAHTVGLKQTILFPYVTLGSLINFCDCFMSGGTSRKNHSEVGSSYIHFNYTPSQHKATPSLLGNVPWGVMLNQRPIFLGGQGGMVGPCQFNFGVTTAAGIIARKNEPNPDRLIFGNGGMPRTSAANPDKADKLKLNRQLVKANIVYIANLVALRQWYRQVRSLFVNTPDYSFELHNGLCLTLEKAVTERVKRLNEYAAAHMAALNEDAWREFAAVFRADNEYREFDELFCAFKAVCKERAASGLSYIDAVKSFDAQTAEQGSTWLQNIVDSVTAKALELFPK